MLMGKASTKAKNKYNNSNYDRINYTVPKGKKEEYKHEAEKRGKSLNEFISDCVEKEINLSRK